jgi:hypothetical protein
LTKVLALVVSKVWLVISHIDGIIHAARLAINLLGQTMPPAQVSTLNFEDAYY